MALPMATLTTDTKGVPRPTTSPQRSNGHPSSPSKTSSRYVLPFVASAAKIKTIGLLSKTKPHLVSASLERTTTSFLLCLNSNRLVLHCTGFKCFFMFDLIRTSSSLPADVLPKPSRVKFTYNVFRLHIWSCCTLPKTLSQPYNVGNGRPTPQLAVILMPALRLLSSNSSFKSEWWTQNPNPSTGRLAFSNLSPTYPRRRSSDKQPDTAVIPAFVSLQWLQMSFC